MTNREKLQKIAALVSSGKDRRKFRCSDSVAALIRFANAIPYSPEIAERVLEELRTSAYQLGLEGQLGDRLRICPICHYIFWANRIESRGCSAKCANVLHQREFRERNAS